MKNKKILYLLAVIFIITTLVVYLGYLSVFPFAYGDIPINRIWSSQLKKTIQDISLARNGSVIAIMTDSAASINVNTGEIIWTTQLPSISNPYPTLVENDVAFLLTNDSLLTLDTHDGAVLWQQPCDCYYAKILDVSGKYILVNYPSSSLNAYDSTSGKLLWSLPAGRGFVDAYIDDNVIYEVDKGIKAIDAPTGKVIREVRLELKGNSFFSNGKLFYEGGNAFNRNNTYIAAFDVYQYKELWRTPLDIQGFSHYLINKESLFVSDQNHIYALLVQNGDLIWSAISPDPTNMAVVKNKVFVLGNFNRTISEFDIVSENSRSVIQIDLPQLLRTQRQDMMTTEDILLFSRGNIVYAYAYKK
jgi:outer membrane protein assembly factor BamB